MNTTSPLELNIAYLYPRSMSIYGDRGNVIALTRRCQWRNIKVTVTRIEVGEKFEEGKYDLVFAGGGQDLNQLRIADDLQDKKDSIRKSVERGVVYLLICGSYQLFGHYFKTAEGVVIPGISILDAFTVASQRAVGHQVRMIGNIVEEISVPEIAAELKNKTLVGFENHSGMTFVGYEPQEDDTHHVRKPESNTKPLAHVLFGNGNNADDGTEGAVYKNCFGTYLHGSFLPKNPHFADFLINKALSVKYGENIKVKPLNDGWESIAHKWIKKNRMKK